ETGHPATGTVRIVLVAHTGDRHSMAATGTVHGRRGTITTGLITADRASISALDWVRRPIATTPSHGATIGRPATRMCAGATTALAPTGPRTTPSILTMGRADSAGRPTAEPFPCP